MFVDNLHNTWVEQWKWNCYNSTLSTLGGGDSCICIRGAHLFLIAAQRILGLIATFDQKPCCYIYIY